MLPETRPETRYCTHCDATMTHVQLLWDKIDGKMQCHSCRTPDVKWEAR